jgi:hypothetical protein
MNAPVYRQIDGNQTSRTSCRGRTAALAQKACLLSALSGTAGIGLSLGSLSTDQDFSLNKLNVVGERTAGPVEIYFQALDGLRVTSLRLTCLMSLNQLNPDFVQLAVRFLDIPEAIQTGIALAASAVVPKTEAAFTGGSIQVLAQCRSAYR